MNQAMRIAMARSGGLGDALNPTLANMGYTTDARGNIFYPDGLIMSGPDVNALSRGRTLSSPISITVPTASTSTLQTYTLANGQQAQLTSEQYQQLLLAQQAAQQQSLVSGGITSGGIKIGSTNISWPMIFVAVLAFILLQSSGFQKRAK